MTAAFRLAEGRLFAQTVALPYLNNVQKLSLSFFQLNAAGHMGTELYMTVRSIISVESPPAEHLVPLCFYVAAQQ